MVPTSKETTMKTKQKKIKGTYSYYHTGTDSFCSPEIAMFASAEVPMNFGHGPFRTWDAAHKDFLKMLKADIENLQYLRDNVLELRVVRRCATNK